MLAPLEDVLAELAGLTDSTCDFLCHHAAARVLKSPFSFVLQSGFLLAQAYRS